MRNLEPGEISKPSPAHPNETSADLRNLFDSLLSRAWLIALCTVMALLGAAYYYKQAPRIYEAVATVQVEQEEQRVVKIEQVLKEDLRSLEVMNTIVQKLRNRSLIERVFATNHLALNPAFAATNGPAQISRDQQLGELEKTIKTGLRRNTRLIDITVLNSKPELAAKIANSIVEEYMGQDFQVRSTSTRGAYAFLRDEAERLKTKLQTSEEALQTYREEVGSVSLQQSQDIIIPQLREISSRLTQSKAEAIRLKAAYDQACSLKKDVNGLLAVAQIATDPAVNDARAIMVRLENEFALVRQRYKAKHPKYIQAEGQLANARTGLSNAVVKSSESIQMAYENAVATERGLAQTLHESEDSAVKLSQQAIRFNMLAREVESDRALFDSIINRLKETSLTTDLQPDKIRVVQPALVPEFPASPKAKFIFGAALLGGLLLGCVLALSLNAFDSSLKTVDEAEQYLRLPVLGAVPKVRRFAPGESRLLPANQASWAGVEAFRTLRTSLAMLGRADSRRSFLFTSALMQEGKSFTSVNFAASLAQQGHRTLLVDLDLRRPSIAKYLIGENRRDLPGVTDFLLNRRTLDEIIIPEKSVDNLSWIPAGTMAPNPAELLAQNGIQGLLQEALKKFDRVVFDTAPVHAVSDTLLVVKHVETTVLVVDSGKTPREPVARCVHLLKSSGAALSGVVLNLLPTRRGRGYYYYYDSYGHYGETTAAACDTKGNHRDNGRSRLEVKRS